MLSHFAHPSFPASSRDFLLLPATGFVMYPITNIEASCKHLVGKHSNVLWIVLEFDDAHEVGLRPTSHTSLTSYELCWNPSLGHWM